MLDFLQHIPGFVSEVEPSRLSAANTKELLQLEVVSRWSAIKGFTRFTRESYSERWPWLLVAHFDREPRCWVIGYVSGELDLPSQNKACE